MRAVLIEWFQQQLAEHGENAFVAANEMIQKYEIIFLQQKHGIQFSSGEHQTKKREVKPSQTRVIPQMASSIASVEIVNVDTQIIPEVVADATPAPISATPMSQSEDPLLPRQSPPPPAPSNVSGEVDVDGILGL